MALTPSNMLALGTSLPDFNLENTVDGQFFNKKNTLNFDATAIMVICNHCPFVKHIWHAFKQIEKHCLEKNVALLAVSANDVKNYPDDSPKNMRALAQEKQWTFPYLYDEDQSFVKALAAACTPDFYVFDKDQSLYYRGRMDESRPGNNIEVTGDDFLFAIDCCVSGKAYDKEQFPSIGCNIKWK